jgi:hypothetical protein
MYTYILEKQSRVKRESKSTTATSSSNDVQAQLSANDDDNTVDNMSSSGSRGDTSDGDDDSVARESSEEEIESVSSPLDPLVQILLRHHAAFNLALDDLMVLLSLAPLTRRSINDCYA